ncbi:MAG: helix-turn-helix domain-containing protein [Lachnospiraceae bacterium]|nr:helix-turn-helix domain-containing protein [Lachnospiraceae bacterium]
MEEKIRYGNLFDFYGDLLNEHQRRICEASFMEDLSLAEIAEEMDMTRQGVHNHLVRAQKALDEYENKLGLYRKFVSIRADVGQIMELVEKKDDECSKNIAQLAGNILDII